MKNDLTLMFAHYAFRRAFRFYPIPFLSPFFRSSISSVLIIFVVCVCEFSCRRFHILHLCDATSDDKRMPTDIWLWFDFGRSQSSRTVNEQRWSAVEWRKERAREEKTKKTKPTAWFFYKCVLCGFMYLWSQSFGIFDRRQEYNKMWFIELESLGKQIKLDGKHTMQEIQRTKHNKKMLLQTQVPKNRKCLHNSRN